MALLRYVARRVGVPALRRASGSPVPPPPSAASRPLAASRSYYYQAGYCNGEACRRQRAQEFVANKAEIDFAVDAILRAKRLKKIERRIYMGSAAIGVWLAWRFIAAMKREVKLLIRQRDLERELKEIMEQEEMMMKMMGEADTDEEEKVDEADTDDGDKKE